MFSAESYSGYMTLAVMAKRERKCQREGSEKRVKAVFRGLVMKAKCS